MAVEFLPTFPSFGSFLYLVSHIVEIVILLYTTVHIGFTVVDDNSDGDDIFEHGRQSSLLPQSPPHYTKSSSLASLSSQLSSTMTAADDHD